MQPFITVLEQQITCHLQDPTFDWSSWNVSLVIPDKINEQFPLAAHFHTACAEYLNNSVSNEDFFKRRYHLRHVLEHHTIVTLAWKLLKNFYNLSPSPIPNTELDQDIKAKLDFLVQEIYSQWEKYIAQQYSPTEERNEEKYATWLTQQNVTLIQSAYPQTDSTKSNPYTHSSPHAEYRYNRYLISAIFANKNKPQKNSSFFEKVKHVLLFFLQPTHNPDAITALSYLQENKDNPQICNLSMLHAWYKQYVKISLFGDNFLLREYHALKKELQRSRTTHSKKLSVMDPKLSPNETEQSHLSSLTTYAYKITTAEMQEIDQHFSNQTVLIQMLPSLIKIFPDTNQLILFFKLYQFYQPTLLTMFQANNDSTFILNCAKYIKTLLTQHPRPSSDMIYELHAQISIYHQYLEGKNIPFYNHGRLLPDKKLGDLLEFINIEIQNKQFAHETNLKFRKKTKLIIYFILYNLSLQPTDDPLI